MTGLPLETEQPLRQHVGAPTDSEHPALAQEKQLLVGRRKSRSIQLGSHGGSGKRREHSTSPLPLLEGLLYSRHSDRVSFTPYNSSVRS